MIFLIEYERSTGRLVDLKRFEESEREVAYGTRLRRELDLFRASEAHEVLILEASDEDALKKTHRRYFEGPETILATGPTGPTGPSRQ